MKNSQLITILRALDKKECRELRKWLQSPFHNQRADVIALFDYLLAGNHLEEEKFLRKERVFRKIYPDDPFDDNRFRQVMHFTAKAVEEYLTFQQFKQDEIAHRLMLAQSLQRRGLHHPLQRTLKQIAKMQESCPTRNEQYFYNEHHYQTIVNEHFANRRQLKEINLKAIDIPREKAYLIEKMRLYCTAIFLGNLQKVDFLTDDLSQLIERSGSEAFSQEPVIGIYSSILRAITEEENSEHFEILRERVRKDGQHLSDKELAEVYKWTTHYCVRKMNSGSEYFRREGFEWYRQGIEAKILMVNGTLSSNTYYNTMSIALKLREFDWSEQFVDHYYSYLDPSHRDTIHRFCRAKLFFAQKRYDRAMPLLAQSDFDNDIMNIEAKSMLTKMYYETDEVDALESLLESFNIYLKRKKIMGYHRSIYQNIIRCTRRLVRINPYDKEKREQLRQEIDQVRPLTERDWLLQQLDRLN